MERITVREVRAMFDRAVAAAGKVGWSGPSYRWILQEGSQTNGRAWRMYCVGPGGGLRDVLGGDGYLGWTTREVYQALYALARGWELARTESGASDWWVNPHQPPVHLR